MFISDLKCLKDFLNRLYICLIQPFSSCICKIGTFFGILKRFSLGSCGIFIIDLVNSYYIVSCVSLNNIVCNFSVLQSSQNLQNLIRICLAAGIFILIFALFGCKVTLYCRITVIYTFGNLTHVCCRILFHLIQNLLSLFFLSLFLLISYIITACRDTYISEGCLIRFIIRNCDLSFCYNRIIHLLLNCLKLQKCFYLIFRYRKFLNCLFTVCSHKL